MRKAKAANAKIPHRYEYLRARVEDTHCRIHKVALNATGFCSVAQAWWVPRFRCPDCAGPLWDNGYCPTCTPKTQTFPGDYFEERWDDEAGREYGHFVRKYKGPTPVPSAEEAEGYLAELRAIGRRIGQPIQKEPGDETDLT